MTGLPLPALDGRTPLGFLAALGTLRLVTQHVTDQARLSFSRSDCTAILSGAHQRIDDLAEDLYRIVATIPDHGVLPGLPPDLPPPGAAPDKLRLPRPALRQYAQHVWDQTGEAGERWLASLVTDLSLDKENRASISLYTAPSGKQSMRTMLEKPLALIRQHPQVLREALTGWRRYANVTGEYLDHQVLYDAADAPDGKSAERGVPGATWLALMAYPLMRTTATGDHPVSTAWQQNGPRHTTRHMIYPLWGTPIQSHTVVALLQHPVLRGAQPGPPPPNARMLSVFLICAAERRPVEDRKFAGVLTPVRSTPTQRPGGHTTSGVTSSPSGRRRG